MNIDIHFIDYFSIKGRKILDNYFYSFHGKSETFYIFIENALQIELTTEEILELEAVTQRVEEAASKLRAGAVE